MSNPSQLLLLADHIKLSLLERQRAISLNLAPNPSQDSNIARSLESFREGIEQLSYKPDNDSLPQLRSQYNDLSRQFHGEHSTTAETTLSSPNDPALENDFARAKTRTSSDAARSRQRTSNLKKPDPAQSQAGSKNVRFRDNPSQESLDDAEDDANRAALFPQPLH